ncbi:PTS sugar transporter subunit IIA [Geosporobacter ferrireducens]|uniref:PTS EIIA type-2 domain-containing protein n=1 Tax=Geosporobacter ferrireducens TaxID=1424294 RepID=A0A1D8GNX6_9FIRM|nr:PTS sugar transporter subunit IIA [Geosporobacter ferrireducens]AOT72640.1 hypothetical protein Gferi_25645 [Geosporobacter ferrireducens]
MPLTRNIATNNVTRCLIKGMEFNTRKEVLEYIGNYLFKKGFVKESFIYALLERERVFPTGLDMGNINVAIPHTDADHVINPAIVVMVLNKPIVFETMGSIGGTVKVDVIFALAIQDPKKQLSLLQKLMELFQNEERLKHLIDVSDIEEFEQIFSIENL